MTFSQFAELPESDQVSILGYELYRVRKINEWRKLLIGDSGDPKKSNLTAEAATMLRLEGL